MNERADTTALMLSLDKSRGRQEQQRGPLRDLDAGPSAFFLGPSLRLAKEATARPPRKRSFWAALWSRV
jgi:hypothetical protein